MIHFHSFDNLVWYVILWLCTEYHVIIFGVFLLLQILQMSRFPFALVVHKFDQAREHPVLVKPHGNAKHSQRIRESTKSLLQEDLKHSTSKVAVNTIFDKNGGMVAAESAGELPRGRPQAYYTKTKLRTRTRNKCVTEQSNFSGIQDQRHLCHLVKPSLQETQYVTIFHHLQLYSMLSICIQ